MTDVNMAASIGNCCLAAVFLLNTFRVISGQVAAESIQDSTDRSDLLNSGDSADGPDLTVELPSLSAVIPSEPFDGPSLSVIVPQPSSEPTNLITLPHSAFFSFFQYSRASHVHTECKAATFMEVVTGTTGDNSMSAAHQLTSDLPNVMDKSKKISCVPRNITINETEPAVQIVNSTGLLHHLGSKNESEGRCAVVLFYAPWCIFCAKVAPHFNALARAFPQLDIFAIDAIHFSNLNSRFGTISVPNILVFHNSKAVARFNNTVRTLDTFMAFVANVTGLKANDSVELQPWDYEGPLRSEPTQDTDYLLILSWLFMCVFLVTLFAKSSLGQRLIQALWQFGEEHHHNID